MRHLALASITLTACAYGVGVPETSDAGGDAGATHDSLSVMALRNPGDPHHPMLGAAVTVAGAIVTDIKSTGTSHGFFMQDPSASLWAGTYVFVGPETPNVASGDVVRVTGVSSTYNGLDEIDARGGTIAKTGIAVRPAPITVALNEIEQGGFHTMAYQSMLVRVLNVVATTDTVSTDFTIGEYDSAATMTVTSYMATDVAPSPFPAWTGQRFASITGHVYASGVAALAPMTLADVVTQ